MEPSTAVAEPMRMATRTAHQRKPSRRARDIMAASIKKFEDAEAEEDDALCNAVDCKTPQIECLDPPHYMAAMKTPQADKWKIAIERELKSLRDNRTWVVVEKPPNVKPLASRLVFKLKLDADRAIERYKAQLVARGDQQVEGVNYQDTFSSVMEMATARIIFAFGVISGNLPRHGDIPAAYTRASPEENLELCMYPPPGMILTEDVASGGKKPVLKLLKNIYGLKQAGRLWNQMLDQKIRDLGYKQSSVDKYLYYKLMKTTLILVGVYVDDLSVTSNDVKLVDEFFEEMKTFDVKDLGTATKFMGIKIEYETPYGYSMSQRTMILNLIEQFGMKDAKSVGTPIAEVVLSAEDMNLL